MSSIVEIGKTRRQAPWRQLVEEEKEAEKRRRRVREKLLEPAAAGNEELQIKLMFVRRMDVVQ